MVGWWFYAMTHLWQYSLVNLVILTVMYHDSCLTGTYATSLAYYPITHDLIGSFSHSLRWDSCSAMNSFLGSGGVNGCRIFAISLDSLWHNFSTTYSSLSDKKSEDITSSCLTNSSPLFHPFLRWWLWEFHRITMVFTPTWGNEQKKKNIIQIWHIFVNLSDEPRKKNLVGWVIYILWILILPSYIGIIINHSHTIHVWYIYLHLP